MPFFKIKDENKLVITNFKVMFTSFKQTSNFIKIKRMEAKRQIKFNNPDIFFTVRNPYKRVNSFFLDKFRNIPLNAKLDSSFKWERPQRVFFPLLGLPIRASNHEEIRSRLLETSFKQYIEMLQRIHQVDEHINPQSWILDHPQYFFFQSLDIDLKSIKIIRIENKAEMEFFSYQTGFNVQKKANTTPAIKEEINLKGKYLKIINDIYAEDFVNLGYNMLKK